MDRTAAVATLARPSGEGLSLRARLDALAELRPLHDRRGGRVGGVPQGAVALLAWWLRETSRQPVVLVTSELEAAHRDACVWAGGEGIFLFPGADTPPFDRVPPSEEVTRRRLAAIVALARWQQGGCEAEAPLLIASPEALLRPTLPAEALHEGLLAVRQGATVERDALLRRLVSLGYRRVTAVSAPGEFAARGGIVDVFGPDGDRPWRAEWLGDEIEELRSFDVESQTSVRRLEAVQVVPARELDLRPSAVEGALAAARTLDAGACREDVREAWVRDLDRLAQGAYDEGVDLFFPYLAGEPPATLADHLPEGTRWVLAGGREAVLGAAERHLDEVESLRLQEEERGELPPAARSGLLDAGQLERSLTPAKVFEIEREVPEGSAIADLGWRGSEAYAGRFEVFAAAAREATTTGRTVLALSRQHHRVGELLREHDVIPVECEELDGSTEIPTSAVVAAEADLSRGFSIAGGGLDVFTDHELFGLRPKRGGVLRRGLRRAESTSARGARRAATGRAGREAFTLPFAPGDLVVHRDHGIGRFVEMRRVAVDGGEGAEQEYMTIEYADGDRLFVPIAHLDRVDRYLGGSEARPSLSKLGTGEWERTKRRVRERTEEVARELLALYSKREVAGGHAFDVDGVWQRELESSFPYEETPDQMMVLEDIKRDMEATRPMDRVVCGDVGFGKTELALRAAFKAAADGRQVGVLVPTTVLAQQHFLTFSERLRAFPITVAQLSRFCSPEEVRGTLEGLRTGSVDIVVGTHRLLQKDVEFRNLGLVIIDEEQRFGVLQKERFKELRVAVDVLSLSATPIPRTLHMSLAGIRDLSVIQTPPEERQPIKTYVTGRDDGLVKEVVTRELARAGQTFFVHNRVEDIEREAEGLRRLIPEARVAVAHGQMAETLLAGVMRRFGEGEIDVLVCTSIIESGLDFPNANTIIINNAHRFGLAQLYQLRGRVGRAGQRAYAYFLYPARRALSEKADKRLEVIADLQDLGAGFKLAMRDLEIRGAGNLLGEEQSGEIAAVGLELYNHLLGQAVNSLRGKPVAESPSQVTVTLPMAAHLPAAYVPDEGLRLRAYRELAACASEPELEKRVRELVDRFGPLPQPARGLVLSLRVRLLAAACDALAVETEPNRRSITIQLPQAHGLDLPSVVRQYRSWLSSSATRLHLSPPASAGRLDVQRAGGASVVWEGSEWVDVLLKVLRELGRLARSARRPQAEAV